MPSQSKEGDTRATSEMPGLKAAANNSENAKKLSILPMLDLALNRQGLRFFTAQEKAGSMERVLELLATQTPASAKIAVDLMVPDLFAGSTPQQKHKLKTRISSLLKTSGRTRALGAVLARRALVDWSIVKSHGATWAPILLHILDLPDRVCWAPAVRSLTFLYTQVHGKAELSREIAGSKIGEFVKRLLKLLPQTDTKLFFAVEQMLELYPTQCRPYLNKLEPFLDVIGGERALASLCFAEKAGPDIWKQRVDDLLAGLERGSQDSELTYSHQLLKLREYIHVAPTIKAKVPANRLFPILDSGLKSYKPYSTLQTIEFMLAMRAPLETFFIQKFDALVSDCVECIDLGRQIAMRVADFMAWELEAVGWIPENYSQMLTRLTKKLITIANKPNGALGVEGLADYVQNAAAFNKSSPASEEIEALARYFTAVIICVPGIPQSVRTQIDHYLLASGSAGQINKATLYAGRFSILPLAIQRLPKLSGLETLVHPRFPPLNISKYALGVQEQQQDSNALETHRPEYQMRNIKVDDEEADGMLVDEEAEDVSYNGASAEVATAAIDEATEEAPLPAIPEPAKPVHHRGLDAPPEKRQKLSEADKESPVLAQSDIADRAGTHHKADDEYNEDKDEDEDELVIPTLTMDSD